MQDYPAAHSMDTEWFAVDADGQLAIFDSGEDGAIPKSNFRVWQTARIHELDSFLVEMAKNSKNRVIDLNIPGSLVAERCSLFKQDQEELPNIDFARDQENSLICVEKCLTLPFLFDDPLDKRIYSRFHIDGWLLLLASNNVITQLEIEHGEHNYAVRFSGEPLVAFVKKCSIKRLQQLFDLGQVLAGKALRDYANGLATLFGLFVYNQDSDQGFPYTCTGKPIFPLSLEDLPEQLQNAVSWNWFDRLRFSESKTIQPIEHTPCNTWDKSGWWIDTQGEEHDQHPFS